MLKGIDYKFGNDKSIDLYSVKTIKCVGNKLLIIYKDENNISDSFNELTFE